jgi:hypothetical protein
VTPPTRSRDDNAQRTSGPHPLNQLFSALIGGGLGLVLGGAAASRLGLPESVVPWVAIAIATLAFLAVGVVLLLRRPRSPS